MQVFEFHFNPPCKNKLALGKENLIFDTFCFEPKNLYEKRVGSLYMAGLLKNILPQNARFLEILAGKIKEKYYKNISSPEKSLREALRIANEHLEKIAKQGDVSWLGNLSFNAISLKDFELNFSKVGDFKIFLIRKGQIIDIEQRLKFDEIEPYPLKIFGNIVSGKVNENDVVLVLSEGIYDVFLKENLLNEIAEKPIAKFNNILNGKKEQLTKVSGICLLIVATKEKEAKERETITEEKRFKIFSLLSRASATGRKEDSSSLSKEVFAPLLKIIRKIEIPRIGIPRIILAKRKFQISFYLSDKLKKKIIPVLILILILSTGFFIFEREERKKIKAYQVQINQIREKINQADSYFVISEYNPLAKKNANRLYQEAWDEISYFNSKLPLIIAEQISKLKKDVSENLFQLNKLEEIKEPELIFEFRTKEFIPQKLISFKDKIYFFTPYSKNIFELNVKEKTGKLIETNEKITEAALISPDSILFFSKPNQITTLKEGHLSKPFFLQEPHPDFVLTEFFSYKSNLYFLDNKNGAIIRYLPLSELSWGTPKSWLSSEIKTATNFKSMAVDGSIWVLTKENTLERYHIGRLQETIIPEIFPEPKNFSKIFTTLEFPELYILEPEQKRLIILDKRGRIVKQYQSEKFDNLLDFSISEDGKTIWLLNGLKVYSISIQL